jgi:hypothetical protein
MTSRERVEAALNHREPDRPPFFEYVLLSPLADTILSHLYRADPAHWPTLIAEIGWEEAVRRNAADRVDLAVRLGHDMMYATPVPSPAGGHETTTLEITDDPVENLRRRNEMAADASPTPDESLLVYSFIREEMALRDVDLPILAPGYRHGVWTDVDLMQAMILAPEIAHRHFQLATTQACTLIDKFDALGIDQVGVGGDFAGNRPIISPALYREFIVPEVRILSRYLHERGKYVVNASDGDLWSVIDDFLIGCEVDGYLEIDFSAGMDLGLLKEKYGERITLYGNLDCGTILSFGTPEDVTRHALDCLEAGSGNGGHIFCASNAITASVPLANYLAAVNAYKDFCSLPQYSL